MKDFFIIVILFVACELAVSETLYVDVRKGSDDNTGSQVMPLRTIQKAVDLVNNSDEPGPTIIKIAPGLYSLENECLISTKRKYSEKDRLIIESDILPDDQNWKPKDMPIIVSVENPTVPENSLYIEASGLKVEINHATIRGLKFIGTSLPKVMYYPIFREGKDLKDLVISQCMFLGDQHVSTSNVAILANGHSLKIDHCVFYGCANAVVYWNAEGGVSKNNTMTHCIIDGGYVSGVWLCQTDDDFEFHHNIVSNCQYAFMRNEKNSHTYQIDDCIINNFKFYSGKSTPGFKLSEAGEDMPYIEKNVIKTGVVQLEKGPGLDLDIPHHYLHIVRGTQGSELGAGLFKK